MRSADPAGRLTLPRLLLAGASDSSFQSRRPMRPARPHHLCLRGSRLGLAASGARSGPGRDASGTGALGGLRGSPFRRPTEVVSHRAPSGTAFAIRGLRGVASNARPQVRASRFRYPSHVPGPGEGGGASPSMAPGARIRSFRLRRHLVLGAPDPAQLGPRRRCLRHGLRRPWTAGIGARASAVRLRRGGSRSTSLGTVRGFRSQHPASAPLDPIPGPQPPASGRLAGAAATTREGTTICASPLPESARFVAYEGRLGGDRSGSSGR